MRSLTGLMVMMLAVGCAAKDDDDDDWGDDTGNGTYNFAGYQTHRYFPLDGVREWEFMSDDAHFLLYAELSDSPEEVGESLVSTIQYHQRLDDLLYPFYTIRWSSDSTHGIQIHGYEMLPATEGSIEVDYSPPLQVTEPVMLPENTMHHSASIGTYTSTLVGVEACPNLWVDDWDCLRVEIDSAGDEPFLGTWWLATSWGPSRFLPKGMEAPWVLVEAGWASDEE